LTRHHAAVVVPAKRIERYGNTLNYTDSYQVSLALLGGKGFHPLQLPPLVPSSRADDTPLAQAGRPIIDFLYFGRPTVSREELNTFLNAPGSGTQHQVWESSRVLDIYLTAMIWKLFGVSWPVYFFFASMASTGVCLLIFLIARKLTGSFWAGWLASLLFLASPFENQFVFRSIRDISPLWFAVLAFGFFVCVVDNFKDRKWNHLSYFLLGVVAIVGIGWRVDVLLFVPFLLVALIAVLLIRHRSWKTTLAAGCLFALGAWLTHWGISCLGPRQPPGAKVVYHMALYGDSSRCNLMGLENSFQVARDDIQTVFNAHSYWGVKNPNSPKPVDCYDPNYTMICQDMYVAMMKYHLYQFIRCWPEFHIQALAAFPEPGLLQGEKITALNDSRLPSALPAYRLCLDPLTQWLPILHLVGALALFLVGRDKVRGVSLVIFSLYYSVAWFAVLPEQKHLGQLLLPLTVTGGIGLWSLGRLARPLFFTLDAGAVTSSHVRPLRVVAWAGIGSAILWVIACWLACPYSTRHRESILNEIIYLAAKGVDAADTLKDSRVFSVWIDPQETRRTGYLLSIDASEHPGYITCRHVHFPAGIEGRVLVTRHQLHPSRRQYFAVSCLHASEYGDTRPYACTVTLAPGSRIVACRKLDLSAWDRLPFSTVFYQGERSPGSPPVGRYPSLEIPTDERMPRYDFNNFSTETAYDYPWQAITMAGLPFEENLRYPGLGPDRLTAVWEPGGAGTLRRPQTFGELCQGGLPLDSLTPAPGVHCSNSEKGMDLKISCVPSTLIAQYSPLSVPTDGVYLFKVKYQQLKPGDLLLKAERTNRNDCPKQCCLPHIEGDCPVKYLEVKLDAGDSVQLQLINQLSTDPAGSEFLIQDLQAYREKNALWEMMRFPE
jgi:hypothetical protein